jgi:hypothetical protein
VVFLWVKRSIVVENFLCREKYTEKILTSNIEPMPPTKLYYWLFRREEL